MLSLSTAYNIKRFKTWKELLENTKKLGFKSVELNVEVPESWLEEIQNSVSNNEVTISSVHNFCPKLENIPKGKSLHHSYQLTSLDEKERQTAVDLTLKSIETAKNVGAKAVVVHAGEVELALSGGDAFKYAFKFGRNAMLMKNYRDNLRAERDKNSRIYLENLIKSLGQIAEEAQKKNIIIGLENRFYFHEIPDIEETLIILNKFKGSTLKYWHDTGHAEISARIGFVENHMEYLDKLGNHIAGFHLHDVKELNDHLSPGSAEIDFKIFKKYMKNDTIKVVEVHHAKDEEVIKSIKYLNDAGIGG